jgi:hypothetical protein
MAEAKRQPVAPAAPELAPTSAAAAESKSRQRGRVSQEDVPSISLGQALRVPKAIADSYAYKPTRPLNVAGAMKISPTAGPFRMLAGAAIAYGLTTGGAFAPEIAITPLGMRIVRPTKPGDDVAAKREALLRPKIVGDFLRQYDGAALPPDDIGKNVLLERGVPKERVDDVLALILEGAKSVGLLTDINGKNYVDLAGTTAAQPLEEAPTPGGGQETILRPPAPAPAPAFSMSPAVNINLEIHIAADAKAATIEEIFKNMRKYVLDRSGAEPSEK